MDALSLPSADVSGDSILLDTVLIRASPELRRDFRIRSAISSRDRFLRETFVLKDSVLGGSFITLRSGIRETYPKSKENSRACGQWQVIATFS